MFLNVINVLNVTKFGPKCNESLVLNVSKPLLNSSLTYRCIKGFASKDCYCIFIGKHPGRLFLFELFLGNFNLREGIC